MNNKKRRARRVRFKLSSCSKSENFRLSVFKSNLHLYAQLIDDTEGKTLLHVSTLSKEAANLKEQFDNKGELLGNLFAKNYLKFITNKRKIVFDRGHYIYTGVISHFADTVRQLGVKNLIKEGIVRNSNKDNNLYESLIDVNRVSKVTKGGRKFAYKAILLVGDGSSYATYGTATHAEVAEAKAKAIKKTKSSPHSVRVNLYKGRTIYHEVWGKFKSSKVLLKPAPSGTGLIAGGGLRKVCGMVGIKDIIAKSYGSSKSHNVIMAVFNALQGVYTPRYIANKRGKKISELVI